MIRDRAEHDKEFRANLHGFKLQGRDGRIAGSRGDALARIKSRTRGHA